LLGVAGEDILFGGDDLVFGGAGNDRMIWNPGDGSDPNEAGDGNDTFNVQGTPDRAPFSLTHRYDTPGTYKVLVIWSDNLGQSNFEDLTLTVQHARHGGHGGRPESGDPDAA
jgi:Ca2+-binding RTX toxin-like protein